MNSPVLESIETKSAPKPVGPYNQAVLVENWLYCSGQIALDPETGEMVGDGDIVEETRQVLKNLIAVVEAAGGESSNVIRTTIYLTDLNDFSKVIKYMQRPLTLRSFQQELALKCLIFQRVGRSK